MTAESDIPESRDALAALAREHSARLRSIAERVLGCRETAAEVVQDVFLRLWQNRASVSIKGSVGGYLARAVKNRALDLAKRRRIESRWLERETADVQHAECDRVLAEARPGDGPDDRARRLGLALERLPARQREVMLLRWRDDLAYAEIARRLGVSAKTVENQVGRGLKALRATLGERR
jgi:RNA polymerase sigma-70 factor (ECF subfamily)